MNKIHRFTVAVVIAVNALVVVAPAAHAAKATVTPLSMPSGAVSVGVPIVVRWQTTNFPSNGKVDINLVKQTSQSPRSFVLVRPIVKGAPNTGSATWTPGTGDIGSDLSVQVGCSSLSTFAEGCVSGDSVASISVQDSGSSLAQKPSVANQAMANTLLSLQAQLIALLNLLKLR